MKLQSISQLSSIRSLLALYLAALPCTAATKVWDGGASTLNWGDATNWDTDGVPANGDTIQFNGGLTSGSTVAVNVGTYSTPSSTLTLANGAGFTLDFNATGGSYNYFPTVNVNDAFAYTINGAAGKTFTFVNGTQNLNIAAGGKLTLTGNFVVASYRATALSKTGGGELDLSGITNYEGGYVSSISTTGGILRLAVKPGTVWAMNNISASAGTEIMLNGNGQSVVGGLGFTVAVAGKLNLDGVTLYNDNLNANWSGSTSGAFNLTSGGGFDVRGQNVSIDKLTGTGKVYNSYSSGTLTVGANGGTSTFDGVIYGNAGVSGTQNYGLYDGNAGTLGLTKTGSGSLTLTRANVYSGATTVNGGKLTIDSSATIDSTSGVSIGAGELNYNSTTALSKTVTFSGTGGTLSGNGTITNAVVVTTNNIQTAGSSVKAGQTTATLGKETFTTGITYNQGSIFEWNLTANTDTSTGVRATNYDAINTGSLATSGSGAIFRVVLNGSQNFSEAFWNTTRTWSDIFTNVDGSTNLDIASIFGGGVQYWNSTGNLGTPTGQGSFTINGSTLTWTAVPEPTSALAGLLLGFGLLRRNRSCY